KWDLAPARSVLTTYLAPGESAILAINTKDAAKALVAPVDQSAWDKQRKLTIDAWNKLLAEGTQIHVPEAVANNAWRACLIGNFMLINKDLMRYSAGNQYQGLYIGDGGDATRCIALLRHVSRARGVIQRRFNVH